MNKGNGFAMTTLLALGFYLSLLVVNKDDDPCLVENDCGKPFLNSLSFFVPLLIIAKDVKSQKKKWILK